MRLTVYNGSPRVKKSNSDILLGHFRDGFQQTDGNLWEQHYLAQTHKRSEHLRAYARAEVVLLTFPLYTDAMPGLVLEFIESLEGRVGRDDNPAMAFLVHSGFPEACHSRPVERYLEKLTRRLSCEHVGTMVKGGSEGIQVMPPIMTNKLFRTMSKLGRGLGEGGHLEPGLLAELAGVEHFEGLAKLTKQVVFATGVGDLYWRSQLKKYGAWEKRFDRPYQQP